MVDFIANNYLIILLITVFLIFALIGYLIDSSKNKKNKEEGILTEKDDITIEEIISTNENIVNNDTSLEKEDEISIPEIDDNK